MVTIHIENNRSSSIAFFWELKRLKLGQAEKRVARQNQPHWSWNKEIKTAFKLRWPRNLAQNFSASFQNIKNRRPLQNGQFHTIHIWLAVNVRRGRACKGGRKVPTGVTNNRVSSIWAFVDNPNRRPPSRLISTERKSTGHQGFTRWHSGFLVNRGFLEL